MKDRCIGIITKGFFFEFVEHYNGANVQTIEVNKNKVFKLNIFTQFLLEVLISLRRSNKKHELYMSQLKYLESI